MKKTGVFLTLVETAEMKRLASDAATTPAFGLSSEQVLSGNDFAAMAYKRMFARLAELAKAHGLPDIPGEYGLTHGGELVTM